MSLVLLAAACTPNSIVREEHEGFVSFVQTKGPELGVANDSSIAIIHQKGLAFKDLNGNGVLDTFEDWRNSPEKRAESLVEELSIDMTIGLLSNGYTVNLPGKASMSVPDLLYGGMPYKESGASPSDMADVTINAIKLDNARQILVAHALSPRVIAEWNNKVQALCESLPYSIPSLNSTDPRNEIKATDEYNAGSGGTNSEWPTPLGLAATFDPSVARSFGEVVSKEYKALGFGTALSPQADIASEPRWRRVPGTFGESPELVADFCKEYIEAFQEGGVNCMVKHWPGGGNGEAGRDAHLSIGKYAVYPGNNIETAMETFRKGAFELNGKYKTAAAVMPYYTVSWNQDPSGAQTGNSYNAYIIDSLLRQRYNYDGLVCTDWGIVPDYNGNPLTTVGKCYGVENLSVAERICTIWEAGVDEFGGQVCLAPKMEAFELLCQRNGDEKAMSMIKRSAVRVLVQFFRAGVFENPYVDPAEAELILTDSELHKAGFAAQQKSIVMVKNLNSSLPIQQGMKVYVPKRQIPGIYSMTGRLKKPGYLGYSVDMDVVASKYTVVECPEDADFALVAITGPDGGVGYSAEDMKKGGNGYMPISLQYSPYTATTARAESIAGGDPGENFTNRSYRNKTQNVENVTDIALVRDTKKAMGEKPVVVLLSCERPVVPEFEPWADAILVAFGVRSAAFLNVVDGEFEPQGLLPMQFPANMETVEEQYEDVPFDMECWKDAAGNKYDFAFGLNWKGIINDNRVKNYRR